MDMSKNRAILHFDGDSFFASVEQMMDYRLRGRPVVTGAERGAPTSLSYEAKSLGLYRGMSMREIKIRCPEVVVVKSNYIAYATFAQRMYAIVRQFTSEVDEYSIDECFADITGLEASLGKSYQEIGQMIKDELEDSLGITFGVGLASSKTLAKAASKFNKPAGFTSVPESDRLAFLQKISIHSIWGLGGVSGTHLQKLGIITAADFVAKEDAWLAEHHFGKAYRDIWLELRGHYIKKLSTHHGITQGHSTAEDTVGSLMTTRTFSPPSVSRSYIFAQLSKNVERVCAKARSHHVKAKEISFFLKTQQFTYHAVSLELSLPISTPSEVLKFIADHFDEVYAEGILYRATGVTLRSFVPDQAAMTDLFGESLQVERTVKTFEVVDSVNARYGKETVFLASTLSAHVPNQKHSFNGAHPKKTLSLPYLGTVQ
jgi:DNA polymerase-4/DNA polymerase V